MLLSGAPAKVSRILGDQSATKPQFAGLRGVTSIPTARYASTQPPSAPSRGQEAPPSANTAAPGLMVSSLDGPEKRRAPSSPKPAKRDRSRSSTPSSASRRSQARRSGVALKLLGKTRPLVPTKVSSPSPAAQSRSARGGNASIAGRNRSAAAP